MGTFGARARRRLSRTSRRSPAAVCRNAEVDAGLRSHRPRHPAQASAHDPAHRQIRVAHRSRRRVRRSRPRHFARSPSRHRTVDDRLRSGKRPWLSRRRSSRRLQSSPYRSLRSRGRTACLRRADARAPGALSRAPLPSDPSLVDERCLSPASRTTTLGRVTSRCRTVSRSPSYDGCSVSFFTRWK